MVVTRAWIDLQWGIAATRSFVLFMFSGKLMQKVRHQWRDPFLMSNAISRSLRRR